MRELPKTGVRLWNPEDKEVITEGCFFPEDMNDDEVISAYVDVMGWLEEKSILAKAVEAWNEFQEQMEAEEDAE